MNRGLDWRWVAIGTAIMFGLNLVAGLLLVPLLGGALPAGADGAPSADAAAAIDRVEARIRAAVPAARVIYLEPDVYRPGDDPAPPTEEVVIRALD